MKYIVADGMHIDNMDARLTMTALYIQIVDENKNSNMNNNLLYLYMRPFM